MVKILMTSAKVATSALLKIKYFEIKLITSNIVYDVTNKILSHDSWSCDESLVTLAFV